MFTLEIGKIYIGTLRTLGAKIMGPVDEDTIEYGLGARFYDERGGMYTAGGELVAKAMRADMSKLNFGDVTGEVPENELYLYDFVKTLHVDSKTLRPEGKRKLDTGNVVYGKVHVNRMGMLIFIDMEYPNRAGLPMFANSQDKSVTYLANGRSYHLDGGSMKSMYDLVCTYRLTHQ